jgi:NADP-dependent 3-hydroxy acid dehydrogenase YdfG
LEKIKDETKNEKIYLELLDLADFDSVREFSKKFLETRTRLDVLINNAGKFFQ